jgi:putative nucleotidyltransferase with HDIG domain
LTQSNAIEFGPESMAVLGQMKSKMQPIRRGKEAIDRRTTKDSRIRFFLSLATYLDTRVSGSSEHSPRVARGAASLARAIGKTGAFTQTVYWAGLLHDIGKICVPDDILSKAGPLTEEEWELMRLHPTVGAMMLQSQGLLDNVAPVIHAHQERYDGKGYPSGLDGENIPLSARILAVVDAYEAMTSQRVYRNPLTPAEAVTELKTEAGRQFDPQIVDVFLGLFPEREEE